MERGENNAGSRGGMGTESEGGNRAGSKTQARGVGCSKVSSGPSANSPTAIKRSCLTCGRYFLTRKLKIEAGRGKYCSRPCIKRKDPETRFWQKVDKSGGPTACWPWTGKRDQDNYGSFSTGHSKRAKAHRMAIELTTGSAPEKLAVCHHCDNPPCCNPAHLFLGTRADNIRDMIDKGGFVPLPPGEQHPVAKLSNAEVVEIKTKWASGAFSAIGLGSTYKVNRNTIYQIVKGQSRKHG